MQRKVFTFLIAVAAFAIFGGEVLAQQKFVAALNSLQVVPPTNSAARANCLIEVNDNVQPPRLNLTCDYSGLSGGITAGHIHSGAGPGQNGNIEFNLNLTTTTTNGRFFFQEPVPITAAQVAAIRAKRWYIDLHTANFPNGEIRGQIKVVTIDTDVDGDSRTDPIVFRPSVGTFYALRSTNNSIFAQRWGLPTDFPFVSDFDGDGLADVVAIRVDLNNGAATVFISGSTGTTQAVQWGNVLLGDVAAPGDYDGDGKTDIAVYRESNGFWYILQSSNNQARAERWGAPNSDSPCPGDYDKDGRTDLCVVRPENNQLIWYIRRSSDSQIRRIPWGLPTDDVFPEFPVDVDADGITDVLTSRVINGQRFYYALRSSDNTIFAVQWGIASDGIRFGDFDADGQTDFVAIRAVNNQLVWYVRQSSDGQLRVINWGIVGDL